MMAVVVKMDHEKEESERILVKARENGVTLKLVGGLAIRNHCEELDFCDRDYADIDLVGLSEDSPKIVKILQELGYVEDRGMTLSTGGDRLLFKKPGSKDHIDVFLDHLNIEHDIDLKKRLRIEEKTISVSDLLLAKLTISRLNEKDLRDIFTILKDLDFGDQDLAGMVNMDYIAKLCSRSWGMYHDVLTAIDRVTDFGDYYKFEVDAHTLVMTRLTSLRDAIIKYPKTKRWRLRALVGTRLPWRRPVELEGVSIISPDTPSPENS